jgi:CheY-like chemotaxis protein
MRKRRVVLFDDDPIVLELLQLYFEERGYEVVALLEPVACPVYLDGAGCDKSLPCADIMITDLMMPTMSGVELLELQARRGCRLDIRNKAVISGSHDRASLEAVRRLGCMSFDKPFHFPQLIRWVYECEARMDLSKPLGQQRRERRDACLARAVVSVHPQGDAWVAEVVNRSDSGLCLRLDRALEVSQLLNVRTELPAASGRLVVRWTRPEPAGGFLAGMSFR